MIYVYRLQITQIVKTKDQSPSNDILLDPIICQLLKSRESSKVRCTNVFTCTRSPDNTTNYSLHRKFVIDTNGRNCFHFCITCVYMHSVRENVCRSKSNLHSLRYNSYLMQQKQELSVHHNQESPMKNLVYPASLTVDLYSEKLNFQNGDRSTNRFFFK